MKPTIPTVLLLVGVIASSMPAENILETEPADWRVDLKIGGHPSTKHFHVYVTSDDRLKLLVKPEGDYRFSEVHSEKIGPSVTKAVLNLAVQSIEEFRFPNGPNEVVDGTSVTVCLAVYGQSMEIYLPGVAKVADAPAAIQDMIRTINEALPSDFRIH